MAATFILMGHDPASLAIDGTPTWLQSPVGTASGNATISSPSLAFDHHGTPAVSWSQFAGSQGDSVNRSERSALGLWATNPISSGVARQTALSFDRAERPTMVWIDGAATVKAQFDDGTLQTIPSSNPNVMNPALSITHDLAGNLRGVFAGASPGDLFSIDGSGGTFSSASIGSIPGVTAVSDLRLTTDDRGLGNLIVRADLSAGGQGVILASEPSFGGNWPSAVLATADAVNGIGIATDPTDGGIALTYTTFNNTNNTSKLLFARFNGASFDTTVVLSSTSAVFRDVSLAFDLSDGLPAIAFEQETFAPAAEELMFAFQNAALTWQTSLVDDTISISNSQNTLRGPSLAFDDFSTSFPAIAYVDAGETLTVAFDPPGVPEPGTFCLLTCGFFLMARRRR